MIQTGHFLAPCEFLCEFYSEAAKVLFCVSARKGIQTKEKERKLIRFHSQKLELLPGFEPGTSSLPRMRSTC